MKVDLLDKFQGTLLGVAIGDTLGHPFEGILKSAIYSRFENFEIFIQENKHLFKTYTDDTQLTLHTAQALIDGNGFKVENFINEYIKWLDDPPIGPGYGCLTSIKKLKYGIPWEQAQSNSGGNGTAMRISPIGLYYHRDLNLLKIATVKSSEITHAHPAASAGALVVARAIAFLVERIPESGFSIEEFFEFIINPLSNSNDKIWREFIEILNKVKDNLHISIESGLIKFSQAGVKSPFFIEDYIGQAFVHPYTLSTVACSIFLFLKKLDSFQECIYEMSTAGGDSDTVGAIGGSLAGCYFGLKNIPPDLLTLVKDAKKILNVGNELYSKFKARNLTF